MLIYYLMYEEGGWIEKAWLLDKEGKVKTNKIAAHLEDREYNLFGLLAARKIRFESEHGQLLLQKERRVDNGPFYQRYEGVLLGTLGETPIRGDGFSEYIRPPRIKSYTFLTRVKMRTKSPGQPHFVQQSQRLYRWTWLFSCSAGTFPSSEPAARSMRSLRACITRFPEFSGSSSMRKYFFF